MTRSARSSLRGGPVITSCIFDANVAHGLFGGAGIGTNGVSTLILMNCTFSNNVATSGHGAGMGNVNGLVGTVSGCTFTLNTAALAGGGMDNHASFPVITNRIFWNNLANGGGNEIVNVVGSTPTIRFSNIQGGFAGTGNINADPLFVDSANGNLRLLPTSPCIDAGDNTAVPPDTADLAGDGNDTEPTPLDLEGFPRFANDPDTPDSGNGGPPTVDMGAYEFYSDCNNNSIPDPCDIDCGVFDSLCDVFGCSGSGDCNGNGIPDDCESDVDGDGVIDDCDNCPGTPNPGQEDVDNDGIGDVCDNCMNTISWRFRRD